MRAITRLSTKAKAESDFLAHVRSSDVGTRLGAIGVLLAGLPLAAGLLDRDAFAAVAVSLPLAALLVPVAQAIGRHPEPVARRKTTVFHPFRPLTAKSAWRRPADVSMICDTMLNDNGTIPVVVGTSGVGKTTLLEVLVPKSLLEQCPELEYHRLSTYHDLPKQLMDLVGDAAAGSRHVIVLDQFEQWLASIEKLTPENRADKHERFREAIRELNAPDVRVAIGIRSEWFYHLRFLGDLIPGPSSVCSIEGAGLDRDDELNKAIRADFFRVLRDEAATDGILEHLANRGQLSPLEAQIVGWVIECEVLDGRTVDLERFEVELKGVPGAIDRYFDTLLAGSRRPDVCLKVLCALSSRTRFRRPIPLSHLLQGLFEDDAEVCQEIEDLVEQRVVVQDLGWVSLAHDYLAAVFHRMSATTLNPTARDNVLVHTQPDAALGALVRSDSQKSHDLRVGVIVGLLGILVLGRFVYGGVDWTASGPDLYRPMSGEFLDASYFPVMVTLMFWLTYVTHVYRNLFAHLEDGVVCWWASWSMLLVPALGIAAAVFVPFAWVLAIAVGGLPTAGIVLVLSKHPQLNFAARDRLRTFATVQFAVLMFTALAGFAVLALSEILVTSSQQADTWLLANTGVAVAMIAVRSSLGAVNLNRSGISQILGLIARPQRVKLIAYDEW